MPQNKPANSIRISHRFTAPTLFATLLVAALISAAGGATTAHAQRNRRPAAQGTQTTGAAQQQQPARPAAKLTPLRTSETPQGSRLTITSTNALSDYSAYRSGDKFYVVIPNADAGAIRGGARGRGFEAADVQKRGNDVVLSFKLKPGAKPRVNQRFNQLDVVFAEGEGASAQTGGTTPSRTQPSETQNDSTTTATQPQPQRQQDDRTESSTSTADQRAAASNAARNSQTTANESPASAGTQPPADVNSPPPAGPLTAASPEAAPTAAPTAATETQIAQAATPAAGAPTKITAEPQVQPGTSIGSAILRNGPLVVIATLLLVGLGLFLAARRSSAARQEAPAAPSLLDERKVAAIKETPAPALKAVTTPTTKVATPPPPKAAAPTVSKVATPPAAPPPVSAPPTVEAKPEAEVTPAATEEVAAPVVAAVTPVVAPPHKPSRSERKKKKRGKKGAATTVVAAAPITAEQLKEETAVQEAPEVTLVAEQADEAQATLEEPTATQLEKSAAPQVEESFAQEPVEAATPEVSAPEISTPELAAPEVAAPEIESVPAAEAATQPAEDALATETTVEELYTAPETTVEELPAAEAEQLAAETQTVEETTPAAEAPFVAAAPFVEEAEPVTEIAPVPEALTDAEAPAADESTAIAPADAGETWAEPSATAEIAPAVEELDPGIAHAETLRLLDGESYDKSLAAVTDTMTRQIVASELLAALSGRNAERRARAHTAFVEHGYFNEAAHNLSRAEAPVERASAARALGLAGDRHATPQLIEALSDPAMEVRRAAVEALANVRDPRAVGALKALQGREKSERIKVPRRLIEHAVQVCAEAPEEVEHTLAEDAAASLVAPAESLGIAPAEVVAVPAVESAAPVETLLEAPVAEASTAFEEVSAAEASTVFEEVSAEESAVAEEVAAAPVEEPPALVVSEETIAEEVASAETLAPQADVAETFEEETPHVETPVADAGASLFGPAAEETAVAVEETPAAVEEFAPETEESVEAPAFEEWAGAEPAAAEEEARPLAGFEEQSFVGFEEQPVVAEDATQLEEPATDIEAFAPAEESAEPSAPTQLEFETHQAETVAETAVAPVEDFEAPRAGTAAEEWFDLDVEDERVEPVEAREESYSRAVVPVEEAEAEELSAPAAGESVAPTNGAAPPVAEIEVAPLSSGPERAAARFEESAGARAPRPAGTPEGKGIAPFVEDDTSAVPKAIQVRLSSEEAEERAEAIKDLGRVGSGDAFRVLCAGFDDASVEVRAAAARSLFNFQEDRAEAFTRALRESNPQRRRNIGAAIASSGLASEAISHLTGESRERTYDAFSLLFLMAKAGEVQPLIRAIESHPDTEVRLAVVKLLALSGQKEILPAFRRLAVRGTLPAEVRSAVMEAIYQISSSNSGQPTTTA